MIIKSEVTNKEYNSKDFEENIEKMIEFIRDEENKLRTEKAYEEDELNEMLEKVKQKEKEMNSAFEEYKKIKEILDEAFSNYKSKSMEYVKAQREYYNKKNKTPSNNPLDYIDFIRYFI